MANYNFGKVFTLINDAIKQDRYGFHIGGSSKLGEIPGWSLVPGRTCSPEACSHCMKEGCYAMKNMLRAGYNLEKNTTFTAWTENTVLAINHLDTLERELDVYFSSINAPRFFRIHVSGDFFSVPYAEMWFRIAKKHTGTKFLAFTKQWNIVRQVSFHELDNFSLILSGWTGIVIPEDLRLLYRCAWCDDGQETRIPCDALECPGNCSTCGLCWALKELHKDTFFHKH